jgi:hypothetical protein
LGRDGVSTTDQTGGELAWQVRIGCAAILIGIGLFVLTSLNGMVFLTPQTKKLKSLIAERSEDDAGVQALVKRVTLASRIDLLILIAIVADMVIKPGL